MVDLIPAVDWRWLFAIDKPPEEIRMLKPRQEAENRGQFIVSCFANRNFESSFAKRWSSCRIYTV